MLFSIFRHQTRIAALEDKVAALERTVESLDLEWTNVYDKVRTTLAKIAKREQRAAQDDSGSHEPAAEGSSGLDMSERIRRSRRGAG